MRAILLVILNNKELQPITTMCFQLNCEQDWKVPGHCVDSPRNNLRIVHHIVYSSQ